MKTVNDLRPGDFIAFGFNYNGGKPDEIIVDNITSVDKDRVLVHFLYGYKSLAEFVMKNDIIAIGDESGQGKIKGYTGKFIVLQPEHELLK